jgi:hypothetical protein
MASYVSHVSNSDTSGAATSLTLTNVAASGGNGIMVGIVWRDVGTTVTGVTFNSSSSGWVHGVGAKVSTGGISADFYYATSLSGTHDIVVTWSGTGGLLSACAVVFSGVNTSTPIGTVVTSSGSASSVNDSATGEVGGAGFDILGIRDAPVSPAVGGTQTQRGIREDAGSATGTWSTDTGAVSQTMAWTWTGTLSNVHIVVPLRAAGGGASAFPHLYYAQHRAA